MAVNIRTVATNAGTAKTISVTTDATPRVGDLMLIFHGNDYYALTDMPTPTVSPGSPTLSPVPGGSADGGANLAHVIAYTAPVVTAGAQTVSVTETGVGDEDKTLVVYVLTGADLANPVDAAAGASSAAATSQPAASVSPSTSDALLVVHNNSGGGASATSYTSPAGMTEQYEIHVGGISGVGATEQLAASGPTGTRLFTASGTNVAWAAVSVAIKAAVAVSWTYGYDVAIGG